MIYPVPLVTRSADILLSHAHALFSQMNPPTLSCGYSHKPFLKVLSLSCFIPKVFVYVSALNIPDIRTQSPFPSYFIIRTYCLVMCRLISSPFRGGQTSQEKSKVMSQVSTPTPLFTSLGGTWNHMLSSNQKMALYPNRAYTSALRACYTLKQEIEKGACQTLKFQKKENYLILSTGFSASEG